MKKETKSKEETKPQTSEELALLLNQNYATLMQAQANIQAINAELKRRQEQEG